MPIARLQPWMMIGGMWLAFLAGIVNASGFLGAEHQGITHLTGTSTLLGIAVGQGDVERMLHFGLLIAAFVGGCAASGALIGDATLRLGRRYGVALAIESVLLFLAARQLGGQGELGMYLASAACGLQNAMASTYSGAVLRTTHFSGTLTDLGIFLGQGLRGLPVDRRRVRLLTALVASFISGAVAGTWLFARWQFHALYLPAAATGLAAVVYTVYRQWRMSKGQVPPT